MKSPKPISTRGAALLISLALITTITILGLSYFAIARQELSLSGASVSTIRADLGEEAAFAEAVSRLRSLTARDDYLVTLATSESRRSRYTFISTPESTQITHTPLFTGGEESRLPLPNFNSTSTTDLTDQSLIAPPLSFVGETKEKILTIPTLSDLDAEGSLIKSEAHPSLAWVELPIDPNSPWRTRYAYWIEDLEGYPNLDIVGSARDDAGAILRYGHGRTDTRTQASPLRLLNSEGTYYRFPLEYRGQSTYGQVAPGLSPREIILQTWSRPQSSPSDHPYYEVAAQAKISPWFSPSREANRFVRGLSPYRMRPTIPYGHDYPDEGSARYNLNTLVTERDIGIADIISKNLPQFIHRKGAFPEDEDYLATLAANAIDYADLDSLPALPENTIHAEGRNFRGVDSYCPVNEFFIQFTYLGYESEEGIDHILFEATPYAEFWNPSNREASMAQVRLRFRFLDPIQFKANSTYHRIEETHRERDDAFLPDSGGLNVRVLPNEYKVVRFGTIRWKVPIPRPPLIAFPLIQDLRGVSAASVRAHYELYLGAHRVDQCGRAELGDDPTKPSYGFTFPRHSPILEPGESFMRYTAPNLAGRSYGFNAGYGSHLGDPWMPWYSRSTAEDALYRLKATPGARNYDHDKVSASQADRFKDQLRVRDWPDRGYDSPLGLARPKNDNELPDTIVHPSAAEQQPSFAPWRISNLGHFYSATELGNLHDPIMWVPGPTEGAESLTTKQTTQRFSLYRETHLKSLPLDSVPGAAWGGGNTLRIGRPEHTLFDQPGMRASQWLDLFHCGFTGTNLGPAPEVSLDELYRHYDPRDHQALPAAPDPLAATTLPYSLLYDPDLHAQGLYTLIYGRLNLNTAPTRFEIETLLRGPFVSSDIRLEEDRYDTPRYRYEGEAETLENGLREAAIPLIAEGLMRARPFYSPSHFARVVAELIERHDALPSHHNDAEAEETFARLFNTGIFSSRHFRIYTSAEVYHRDSGEIAGRSRRVRDVFLRPIRHPSGTIERVQFEVFSTREL